MNSQELRALQEAYNQVCELDEGKKEFPHKKVDKQVYDAMDSGETAGDAGNRAKEKRDYGRADRMRSVAAKHGGKSRVREETDLFDYILEHLVAEGYADTNKAALAIMANMSEEWRESIVEKHATFGYNAEDPLDDFEQFVDKGPKTNKQKRNAIELNNKILSKPGMPVKGV
jgi:hypothetical protein